jgi:hypothetical protein
VARSGLAVILSQAAENPRQERCCLDLALAGGGVAQGFAALDDELFAVYLGPLARARRRALLELARQEEQVSRLLAFAGGPR